MIRSRIHLVFSLFLLIISLNSFAQEPDCDCSDGTPTTEAQLAAGGDFCGNVTIDVGTRIDIAGDVCWSSGNLVINSGGGLGDMYIDPAVTFNLDGGTLRMDDGDFNVELGGTVIVGSGATLTGDGGIDDITVFGTMIIAGTVSVPGDDFQVNGGTVTVQNGGFLDIDDDLKVYNGGTLTGDAGSDIDVGDRAGNNDAFPATSGTLGTFVINGDLDIGNTLQIFDTTPDSGLTGSGTITGATGGYTNEEVGDFTCPSFPCTGSGALPVDLIDFYYEINNDVVTLYWSTASELNNLGFSVERSFDGESFDQIAFIDGNGTTNNLNNYNLTDLSFEMTGGYYRLKQVDFDGAFEYSQILFIDHTSKLTNDLKIYPNPTAGTISLPAGLTNYSFYNSQGQILLRNINTTSYYAEEQINLVLNKAKKGIYFLSTTSEGRTLSTKIIKQ